MHSSSGSALDQHFLDSILPHPQYPHPQQFLKNKQFFRPEKFIWNNPHRASSQMYKFYHAYNDQYAKYKEPLVQELERRDRERSEMDRIYRLIAFRQHTRHAFNDQQRTRALLEQKTRQQPAAHVRIPRTERKMGRQEEQYISNPGIQGNTAAHYTPNTVRKSERLLHIEEGYREGVRKHDAKTEQINRLIDWQTEEAHRKIRGNFATRRQVNLESNSKVSPRGE